MTRIQGLPHSFGEPAELKDTDPGPAALIGQPAALGAPENRSLVRVYAPAALVGAVDIILLLHEAIRQAPGRGRAGPGWPAGRARGAR